MLKGKGNTQTTKDRVKMHKSTKNEGEDTETGVNTVSSQRERRDRRDKRSRISRIQISATHTKQPFQRLWKGSSATECSFSLVAVDEPGTGSYLIGFGSSAPIFSFGLSCNKNSFLTAPTGPWFAETKRYSQLIGPLQPQRLLDSRTRTYETLSKNSAAPNESSLPIGFSNKFKPYLSIPQGRYYRRFQNDRSSGIIERKRIMTELERSSGDTTYV